MRISTRQLNLGLIRCRSPNIVKQIVLEIGAPADFYARRHYCYFTQ